MSLHRNRDEEGCQTDNIDAKASPAGRCARKENAEGFLLTARTEVRDGTHVVDADGDGRGKLASFG